MRAPEQPQRLEEGSWIPYLTVTFEITKVGSSWKASGDFMPMVASNGPHDGDNIKLGGPRKYKVEYTILPPGETHGTHFGRHTDRETAVHPWFKAFDVENEFPHVSVGKKGRLLTCAFLLLHGPRSQSPLIRGILLATATLDVHP